MRPASDFDRIASNIAIWHEYDSAVKAELYSACLGTPNGTYLIDPIPLESEALYELTGSNSVAGIIVTSSNHHRACAQFAEQFSVPIFARADAFPVAEARGARPSMLPASYGGRSSATPNEVITVAEGDEICSGLRVISVEGAAPGEIALHYARDGGTFIIGDALINFEPHGFTFLPAKYCSNQKQMRRSLRKLLAYKAQRMLFAHGAPILSGASERLQGLLNRDF